MGAYKPPNPFCVHQWFDFTSVFRCRRCCQCHVLCTSDVDLNQFVITTPLPRRLLKPLERIFNSFATSSTLVCRMQQRMSPNYSKLTRSTNPFHCRLFGTAQQIDFTDFWPYINRFLLFTFSFIFVNFLFCCLRPTISCLSVFNIRYAFMYRVVFSQHLHLLQLCHCYVKQKNRQHEHRGSTTGGPRTYLKTLWIGGSQCIWLPKVDHYIWIANVTVTVKHLSKVILCFAFRLCHYHSFFDLSFTNFWTIKILCFQKSNGGGFVVSIEHHQEHSIRHVEISMKLCPEVSLKILKDPTLPVVSTECRLLVKQKSRSL